LPIKRKDQGRYLPIKRKDQGRYLPIKRKDQGRYLPIKRKDQGRYLPPNHPKAFFLLTSMNYYTSHYFTLFSILQYALQKYNFCEKIPVNTLVNHSIAIGYTYLILFMAFLTRYFPWYADGLVTLGMHISNAYYTGDCLYIIIYDLNYWPFLFHHGVTLYLYNLVMKGVFEYSVLTSFLFYIEVSNSVLNVWNLAKKYYPDKARDLTYYAIMTYVPYRTVVTPYFIYRILTTMKNHDYFYQALVAFGALGIMSVWYSYLIVKKNGLKISFTFCAGILFFYELLPRIIHDETRKLKI